MFCYYKAKADPTEGVQRLKRSAYWDLQGSSEPQWLVYEQNDWLEQMLQVHGLRPADAQK